MAKQTLLTLSLTQEQMSLLKDIFEDAKQVRRSNYECYKKYSALYKDVFIQVAEQNSIDFHVSMVEITEATK